MDYYDLGTHTRSVSTGSRAAQLWFGRGLVWAYAFNHEEAATCFEQAIHADPQCAMAYWGLAYALRPNYNKPWDFFDDVDLKTLRRTHAAVTQAATMIEAGGAPAETALVRALQQRYPVDTPAWIFEPAATFSIWNQNYANAMRRVYLRFPDDLDVAVLFADALMNVTPWALWDLRTGAPAPGSHALEAHRVLDRALAADAGRAHPGVLHMYIHLMEMSSTPESALVAADRLRGLVPDAGHLHHMPTHIDMLCGDYRQVVRSNTSAVQADTTYLARQGALNFYTLYRCHNYHFKIYGAMFLGQSQVALHTADHLEASIPAEFLRVSVPPMADWLEGFSAMRIHVLIRFGMWEEIIALALPQDRDLYTVTTAMTHYAKGVAYSATGDVDLAAVQRVCFHNAVTRVAPTRRIFNNTCLDIVAVAAEMLDGELQYRKKNYAQAFAHLRRSIELEDTLPYDEPWGWMQPTRHAYGALLLERGQVREAEAVYRADLGLDDSLPRTSQHPGNVWALHGLHECLTRLDKHSDAAIIAEQLTLAAAMADVAITASCFCRSDAVAATQPSTTQCRDC